MAHTIKPLGRGESATSLRMRQEQGPRPLEYLLLDCDAVSFRLSSKVVGILGPLNTRASGGGDKGDRLNIEMGGRSGGQQSNEMVIVSFGSV